VQPSDDLETVAETWGVGVLAETLKTDDETSSNEESFTCSVLIDSSFSAAKAETGVDGEFTSVSCTGNAGAEADLTLTRKTFSLRRIPFATARARLGNNIANFFPFEGEEGEEGLLGDSSETKTGIGEGETGEGGPFDDTDTTAVAVDAGVGVSTHAGGARNF